MEKQPKPDALDRALTALYRTDIPEGYRAGWREAVQREERQTMQKAPKHGNFWRIALPVAAALVLVLGAIGAGNLIPTTVGGDGAAVPEPTAETQYLYDSDTVMGAASNAAPASGTTYGTNAAVSASYRSADTGADTEETEESTSSAKIVRTADLTVASMAFDEDIQALTDLTTQLGGYVASVSISGEASERMDRVAYYSLRIPSEQLDAFLNGVEGIGRITSRYESATDMTTQYSDTQMRLTTQQEKMSRLQELIGQADDVSDLLEIESEIADTQYQIDRLESSLRTIDRNVDNSAVSVTLLEQSAGETAQTVELTLWQRIESGFKASVDWLVRFAQNLLVFIVMLLPVLAPLAVIAVVIWLIVRARRRRKARRAQAADAALTDGRTQPARKAPEASAETPKTNKE